MKKGIILLLFLFMLTACENENEKIDVTIDVCKDDCVQNDSEVQKINVIYNNKYDEFVHKLAPNNDQGIYRLEVENYYSREDVNTIDPISGNSDIDILKPFSGFNSLMNSFFRLVENCQVDTVCELDRNTVPTYKEVDYGYTENNGYYSYEGYNENDELYIIEYGKYNYDGEYGNFEQFIYVPSENYYLYNYFINDTYYSYEQKANSYEYAYVDIQKQMSTFIYSSTSGTDIIYTNDQQVTYKYFEESNSYVVKAFDDFEFVSSLKKIEDSYTSHINFNYVDDWDALYLSNFTQTKVFDILYNDEVEVYSDYDFITYSYGLRYYAVESITIMSENELATFAYPETFSGELSFNDLKEEVDYLSSLSDPFDLLDFTEDSLIKQYSDFLEQVVSEYNIE